MVKSKRGEGGREGEAVREHWCGVRRRKGVGWDVPVCVWCVCVCVCAWKIMICVFVFVCDIAIATYQKKINYF